MQNSENSVSYKSYRNDPVENILSNSAAVEVAAENQGPELNSAYEGIMADVNIMDYQKMIMQLQEDGISIMKDFQRDFRLSCVKTDWESTIYEIKYGRFSLFFKLISIDTKAEIFCGPAFNGGSFGEIVIMKLYNNFAYALKNIRIQHNSSSSIQLAFKQIFIAKVASALRVGPKFEKILSYDAVLYQDCLQFAMEVCDTMSDHPEIQKEKQNKNLLKILKTLHSFHICHMDIKNDNIAWSRAFNKLVLLDFGFSEILKMPAGYKKYTKFKGTFKYCSPEMKRLFILKQEMKIDLYYNDLHCLQVAWENMKANTFSIQNQDISQGKQNFQDLIRNNLLIRYLSFKMNVFMAKFNQIKGETELIQTFKKIIEICLTQYKNDLNLSPMLEQAYLILTQKFKIITETKKDFHPIDTFLLQIETNKQNNFPSVLYRQIVEASSSNEEFTKIWNMESWKQQIFFFVDIYSTAGESRQKLVEKIYNNIANANQPLKQSYTMKFREVLIYYRNYFAAKKNTANLERILAYFVLLKDSSNRQHTEAIILNHWEEQAKYADYLRENFKYFITKAAMIDVEDIRYIQQNIRNAVKIVKKINKIPQKNIEIVEYGQKIIEKMNLIKNILKSYEVLLGNIEDLALQKLELSNQELWNDADILKFLKIIVNPSMQKKQTEIFSFTDTKYESFYVEKCAFLLQLQNNFRKTISKKSLNLLISSEKFFTQFLTFENLYTLNKKRQSQAKLRSQFCQDIGQIFLKQNPLQNIKLLRIYVNNCSLKQVEQISLDFLTHFDLGSIKKVSHISIFLNLLKCILESFLIFKFGTSQLISKQVLQKFSRIALDFLDFTTNRQILEQGHCSDSESEIQQIKVYAHTHKLLRFIVFILMDREDEIMGDLLEILEVNLQFKNYDMTYCIFDLSVYRKQKRLDQRLGGIVLKQMQSLIKSSDFSTLVYFPKFFQLVMQAYRTTNLQDEALQSIIATFKAIHLPHFPITATPILQIVTKFIQSSPAHQLQNIVNIFARKKLQCFQELPGLTYLLFVAHVCLKTGNAELYCQTRYRVMMICLPYARLFCGQNFQGYRSYLYNESYLYNRNPNKSTRIRHKRKLAPINEFKDSELLALLRSKSKKPNKGQRRQSSEQAMMDRVKLYMQALFR